MRYIVVIFFLMILGIQTTHAQDYKKHKVEKGETVTDISKKYKVTPYDIYRLNPDSKNGIKENTILLIPGETKKEPITDISREKTTKVANTIHEVQPKETLYSLTKRYGVSEEDLVKVNGTDIRNGLQIGQKVIIPIKGSGVAAQVKVAEKLEDKKNAPSYLYHTVEAGETKYSIAKQYGMTLQLLEALNPEVKDTLPIGYKIKLDQTALLKKENLTPPVHTENNFIIHIVAPKETFYNLTRKTGLTEQEIIALNPEAKNGLKEGMELKLPKENKLAIGDGSIGILPGSTISGGVTDFSKTLVKTVPKEMALLLPFNLAKIEADTSRSQQQRLRTDKFLNLTLDFYSGALMAIDSAKILGLPLKVKIYDSKETKNSSEVDAYLDNLVNADVVIGPFFQANAEVAAKLLAQKNIPVISPLSKESGKMFENLYQSIPAAELVKRVMLNYLKSRQGNVIVITDPKKASTRQFIKENYPLARFIEGSISEASIEAVLSKDKMNYVILDSESTGTILNTTKLLDKALESYNIQLVVLEKTEHIDDNEIPLSRLSRLKLLYPSITRDNETQGAAIFAKEFKAKNGVFPNQFATRGFDVTFDAIMRLFQQEGFGELMKSKASEQVENKFVYIYQNGGYHNTGVYIMYYDEDLSVKLAE